MKQLPLLVILGPTAAGKTDISLQLARKLDAEIISADSMQVYQDMDIGTAKVGKKIRKEIPHHMIDIITPEEEYSVARYQNRVDKLIPKIHRQDRFPVMVGGTGLYIKAVVEGFLLPDMDKNTELRQKLRKKAQKHGKEYVHDKLKKIDPPLAKKLHPNDIRRVIRGIEIYHQTGKTKTEYIQEQEKKPHRYSTLQIGLTRQREKLYRRINKRVDIMLERGLIEEVKHLKQKYNLSKTARQALGYKEILSYLNGKISKNEAVKNIKKNTRHLAKKQLTWFNRDDNIIWFNLSRSPVKEIREEIQTLCHQKWS